MSPQLEITTEENIEKKEDRDPSVTSVRDRDIMSTVVGTKILPNVPNLGGRDLSTMTAVWRKFTLMRLSHTRSVFRPKMK